MWALEAQDVEWHMARLASQHSMASAQPIRASPWRACQHFSMHKGNAVQCTPNAAREQRKGGQSKRNVIPPPTSSCQHKTNISLQTCQSRFSQANFPDPGLGKEGALACTEQSGLPSTRSLADQTTALQNSVTKKAAREQGPHLVAVVAEDVGYPVGVVGGHGGVGHLLVDAAPDGRQISVGLHADGAQQLPVLLHVLQALAVDGVAARQHRRRPHTVKQVLEANRAVLPHAVLHAHVVPLHVRSADVSHISIPENC